MIYHLPSIPFPVLVGSRIHISIGIFVVAISCNNWHHLVSWDFSRVIGLGERCFSFSCGR